MDKIEIQHWFSDGSTMIYPARGRTVYWFINLILFALLNMFMVRIQLGEWIIWRAPERPDVLIPQLLSPINIFHFPIHILVVALLTALVCAIPICISLLYNLLHAVPFILTVLFLGHNPLLSLCLLISTAFVGFEPFRFKSKFIAAVLALLPIILYWVIFAGENTEAIALRWAALYSPWALAFIAAVALFGLIILIGHFLRYRPGIIMPVFGLVLAGTIMLFHHGVGMNERDYQADVLAFSPDRMQAFRSRSIVTLLERELAERTQLDPYLSPDLVRNQLRFEWRWAFRIESETNPMPLLYQNGGPLPTSRANQELAAFYQARTDAVEHINKFIFKHENDLRLADALYYKALMFDLKVDTRALRDKDTLRFYYNIPDPVSEKIWQTILDKFPETDIALEARWRLARLKASRQPGQLEDPYGFATAAQWLEEADQRIQKRLATKENPLHDDNHWPEWLMPVFTPLPPTITTTDLKTLEVRVGKLMTLINPENRSGNLQHDERLAELVSLDPQQLSYEHRLKKLQLDSPQPDPLIDNIALAHALLEEKVEQRIRLLREIAEQYPQRDGGIEARLEMVLAILQNPNRPESASTESCRSELQKIIELRPDLFAARYARKLLQPLQIQKP